MQLVFVGTQDAIYAVDAGVNTLIPIENSAVVSVSGWSLNMRLAGTTLVLPFKLTSKLGTVAVSGGSIYSGTLGAAAGTIAGNPYVGFASGNFGTLSPASDLMGDPITQVISGISTFGAGYPALTVRFGPAVPPSFKSVSFPSLGLTYLTSSAVVHGNSGLGPHFVAYEWPSPPSFVAGNAYAVKFNL
jgi:hypothetical protein